MMRRGYRRTLQPEDLFTLGEDITVESMNKKFETYFTKQLTAARATHIAKKCAARNETPETSLVDIQKDMEDFTPPRTAIVGALWSTFKWQYGFSIVLLILANTGMSTNPLLTKKLIEFVEGADMGHSSIGKGIGYSIGTSFVVLVSGILQNHFFYRSMLTGAQAKAVLTKSMLAKSFRLSSESKHQYPIGKITSMMGTDLSRIDFALGFQPFLVAFPVSIGIAIAILIVNIGVLALVGIGLLIVFTILTIVCVKLLLLFRRKATTFTDARVNFMKESLNNLKIIKYYAWEGAYLNNISEVRHKEMHFLFKMQILRNGITAFAMTLTLFASMLSFLVVYKTAGNGSAASVFSSITLFNVMTQQVIMLPKALAAGSDAYLGLTRVGRYLTANEIDPMAVLTEALPEKRREMNDRGVAIDVVHATFEWEKREGRDRQEEESGEKEKIDNTHETTNKFGTSSDESARDDDSHNNESYFEKGNEVLPCGMSLDRSPIDGLPLDGLSSSTLATDSKKGNSEKPKSGLHDIDLEVRQGEFVVVTGLIGSGKTSLLSAISGFMNRTSGSIAVNGSLLMCGTPWVQNATVKENIVFGRTLDEQHYREVIYACSLESDLEILPGGDQTEVGERGITLSGGQKARINLARAVYGEHDIILLDDVLSAVDARVGKHIVNNCLLGMLKDKTRILATHQLSLVGSADRIIFMNGDGLFSVGTQEELQATNAGFANLMAFNGTEEKEDEEEEEEEEEEEKEEEQNENKREPNESAFPSVPQNPEELKERRNFNANNTTDGRLTVKEHQAVNQISWRIYSGYFRTGSGKIGQYFLIPSFVMCMILAAFFQLFTNTWLSFWTEYKFKNRPNNFYIGLYVAFTFLSFIFLLLEFVILVYITNTASVRLNVLAVGRILRSPMSFMDTTPMGRVLNRFTKDTDVLDNEIGDQIRFFLFTFSNICGVLILCIIYLPWFAIAVPFLGFLFVVTSNFYQASAREAKRLEAVQRSLVYNNFNETLAGMSTIQAYKHEDRFIAKSDFRINKMDEAYYVTIANQRWLAIHMTMIACIFALLISLLCVCRVFNISPASVGLLLSYVFQIASQLTVLIKTYTQVENEMNSAERLSEYAFDIPQEAPHVITELTPSPNWPEQGCITFEKVNMAYRPGLPLVLKNLNFDVKSTEKIGICGRTGAGKSSIMSALYRLSELDSGRIIIDGEDISRLGLHALRTKLSIIPQDPVLFRGTVRRNLDPFGDSSDDKLWDALRRTGLIEQKTGVDGGLECAPDHKFHLDQTVDDDGSNFSLGERQLIAFARALVRGSRILILDEATSSVDYETDAKIQETIAREFAHCTILCIAHRLKTIINYDRILVMDKGEMSEYDTPWNLFNNENSIFRQMCERSLISAGDFK